MEFEFNTGDRVICVGEKPQLYFQGWVVGDTGTVVEHDGNNEMSVMVMLDKYRDCTPVTNVTQGWVMCRNLRPYYEKTLHTTLTRGRRTIVLD